VQEPTLPQKFVVTKADRRKHGSKKVHE
jgi:hypothetical protein